MEIEEELAALPGGDAALAYISRYSAKITTYKSYRTALLQLLRWCARRPDPLNPRDLRPIHFEMLRREMLQEVAPRTVAHKQSAIIGFYRYLHEHGEIEVVPVPPGWKIKTRRALDKTNLFTPEQLETLREAAFALGDRMAVVFILLVPLHFKASHVRDATIEHFRLNSDGSVTVSSPSTWGAMFAERRVEGADAEVLRRFIGQRTSGPLLTSGVRGPMNQKALQVALNTMTKKAGLPRTTSNLLRVSALDQSVGVPTNEWRPERFRAVQLYADASGQPVHPAAFAKELVALSDVLLNDARNRPVAAAVLTGTALEHFLRRLAHSVGSTSSGGGIEAWSGSLRQLGVISAREKKRITLWADFRNAAVHGDDGSPITTEDARAFNGGMLDFIETHQAKVKPDPLSVEE